MIVATETLSRAEHPKQVKLLGATVKGLGVVVAVSSTLTFGYAIVEGADRESRRVAFSELKRDEVELPAQPQPFATRVERVSYGTWDEVHSLIPAQPVVPMALLITPSGIPDLITVPCPSCKGDGYHLHDDPMLSNRCTGCFGSKVTEVCADCLEVPEVVQGVETCGCVMVLEAAA